MSSALQPRTALVLSAGGMFGAYQAGVWDVLSELFAPSMVVGASVGCLNGWMIASGVPRAELVRQWSSLMDFERIRFRFPRRFTDGIIEAGVLEEWVREMTGTMRPQVDYGLVLTRFRTLRPQLFRWPHLGWQHLLASCAVPGFLRMQWIDGVLYADGGIVDPLPVWGASEMGAETIVSVNVMHHRPPLLRPVVRFAQAYARYTPARCDHPRWVEINPSEPLGPARDSVYWTRRNAGRWIDLGRRDAERSKHRVVECLGSACQS